MAPIGFSQACEYPCACHGIDRELGRSYDKRNASIRGKRVFFVDTKLFPAYRPELFEVTEVVSPQLYRIVEHGAAGGFTDIVHVQRLKPFTPRGGAVNLQDFYNPLTPASEIVLSRAHAHSSSKHSNTKA